MVDISIVCGTLLRAPQGINRDLMMTRRHAKVTVQSVPNMSTIVLGCISMNTAVLEQAQKEACITCTPRGQS